MSKASRKAYNMIRERILSGEFPPGVKLKEEEISAYCGVSRTPIRDAYRRLAAEYFVRIVPNHGAYVSEWSAKDVVEVFTLRAMLESYAAKRAAENMSNDVLEQLEACCRDIDALVAKDKTINADAFLAANHTFHRLVRETADSERLMLMLEGLIEPRVVIGTAAAYEVKDIERSNEHHWELISAFRSKDGDWAQSVMNSHVHSAFQAFRHKQAVTEL